MRIEKLLIEAGGFADCLESAEDFVYNIYMICTKHLKGPWLAVLVLLVIFYAFGCSDNSRDADTSEDMTGSDDGADVEIEDGEDTMPGDNIDQPPDGAPNAVNDTATTREDTMVVIDVLANDSDPDGDPIVVDQVAAPLFGEARLLPSGQIEYTPPGYFNGTDEFEYTIVDQVGGGTATATVAATISPVGADFYVELNGDDGNPGTIDQPFATLEQARTALRDLKSSSGLPPGGVAIWLRGGTYERTESFVLESRDSGEPDRPVVLIGYPGEIARVVGGARLDADWFSPVTAADTPVWERLDPAARGNVMRIDLTTHGIDDYGELLPRGYFEMWNPAALELSFNDEAMDLARWPDRGATDSGLGVSDGFASIKEPVSSGSFAYLGDRPSRWNQAEEIWLHGYWAYWWTDLHWEVASIDTDAGIITLTPPILTGIEAGKVYYAENLLEEITVPGEWYLDRTTGALYFWPPSDLASGEIIVSMMYGTIIRIENASHVQLRDLTIASGRGMLAQISGGSHNLLFRCHLNNAGTDAVWVSGVDNGLESCAITRAGNAGVRLFGGDRPTLTRAGNFVRNCNIHHFGRWQWTYMPAVDTAGDNSVGHVISHNHIHDAPHMAIVFKGNEHLIELNDIHDVCRFSSDSGAIYTGFDWGFRGNLIRHNFIHHISSSFAGLGVHGVYMDGCGSGTEVFGNIFYEIDDYAVLANGGRDNIMHNNVMAHCGLGLHGASRGLAVLSSTPGSPYNMLEKLEAVPWQGPLWSEEYPELARIPTTWDEINNPAYTWRYPEGCVFSRNVCVDFTGTSWNPEDCFQEWNYEGTGTFNKYEEMIDNIEINESDLLFVDEAGGDLSLDPASPAFMIPGFVDIPFHDIGIQP